MKEEREAKFGHVQKCGNKPPTPREGSRVVLGKAETPGWFSSMAYIVYRRAERDGFKFMCMCVCVKRCSHDLCAGTDHRTVVSIIGRLKSFLPLSMEGNGNRLWLHQSLTNDPLGEFSP